MTIVINGIEVRDVPIKAKEIAFDKDGKDTVYVDADGKRVKKVQKQGSVYEWYYEDGSPYNGGKAYKAKDGKPVVEFQKRTVVDKFNEIDIDEVQYFIQNDHTYLLVSSTFKEQMKGLAEEFKAISFNHVVARGFKVYNAVITYDKVLDKVIMRCFRGDLRKADLNDNDKKVKKEIEVPDTVEQLDLDALEA